VTWRGYWPAAPTPFTAGGALDEVAWRALLALYLEQGVHGVLVNGSTGEWASQTPDERRRVAEIAVDAVAGVVPVVVGVTSYTAREAGELARHAVASGADGVLATPPPYVHPSDREILAFYAELCDAAAAPVMVYNWPRGVSVDISPDLAGRLAALDGVVAIKESTGDWLKALALHERVVDVVRVFGTFISRRGLAVLRELGGDGNIDGGGLGAVAGVGFYEAVWRGDLEAARTFADRYQTLQTALVRPDFSGRFGTPPAQLKAAMRLLGQPGGHVRPPLLEVDGPDELRGLQGALERAGLLPAGIAL
jgi:4-hydroxy-tetrahydrodipicolinate synthase